MPAAHGRIDQRSYLQHAGRGIDQGQAVGVQIVQRVHHGGSHQQAQVCALAFPVVGAEAGFVFLPAGGGEAFLVRSPAEKKCRPGRFRGVRNDNNGTAGAAPGVRSDGGAHG
ncbi:hypothetical protein DW219_06980 [Desulfovibrio sp. AM18-2]|nr:hypothetical protein DW219_06980 [Desulfovibrio sp. AM18-2]